MHMCVGWATIVLNVACNGDTREVLGFCGRRITFEDAGIGSLAEWCWHRHRVVLAQGIAGAQPFGTVLPQIRLHGAVYGM